MSKKSVSWSVGVAVAYRRRIQISGFILPGQVQTSRFSTFMDVDKVFSMCRFFSVCHTWCLLFSQPPLSLKVLYSHEDLAYPLARKKLTKCSKALKAVTTAWLVLILLSSSLEFQGFKCSREAALWPSFSCSFSEKWRNTWVVSNLSLLS